MNADSDYPLVAIRLVDQCARLQARTSHWQHSSWQIIAFYRPVSHVVGVSSGCGRHKPMGDKLLTEVSLSPTWRDMQVG